MIVHLRLRAFTYSLVVEVVQLLGVNIICFRKAHHGMDTTLFTFEMFESDDVYDFTVVHVTRIERLVCYGKSVVLYCQYLSDDGG